MGPWMDGCVPDSSRYVPGLGSGQFSVVVVLAATSVANDCTRGPCGGGVNEPGAPAIGHETLLEERAEWSGLVVHVEPVVEVPLQLDVTLPRPPPTWPTIMIEVGTEFPFAKVRLFVRLIVSPPAAPMGTVITTGDQPAPAFGFRELQVAVEFVTAAPQL